MAITGGVKITATNERLYSYLLPLASSDSFFSSAAWLDEPADLIDALMILRRGINAYYERRRKGGKN